MAMGSGPEKAPQQLNKPFELTPEENALVNELSREAVWKRGIPFSAGTMVGVATLVKTGKMKGHPQLGPLPKMAALGFIAFFAGKLSYIPVMQQQILQRLPNSNLAAQLRKTLNKPQLAEESPVVEPELFPKKRRDDYQPQEGLDDRFRPSLDREMEKESPSTEEKKVPITHDELRRRNREQYEESRKNSTKSQPEGPITYEKPFPPPNPDTFLEPNKEPEQRPDPPARKKRTNIWGDEIE